MDRIQHLAEPVHALPIVGVPVVLFSAFVGEYAKNIKSRRHRRRLAREMYALGDNKCANDQRRNPTQE